MSIERYPAGSIEVRGQTFQIEVDDRGYWWAPPANGQKEIHGNDRDSLRNALMIATKRAAAKVSIPFSYVEHGKIIRGVCTGRHSGNGNLLIEWIGPDPRKPWHGPGSKRQVDAYNSHNNFTWFTGELNDEQAAEIERLRLASKKAQDDYLDFIRPLRLNLADAVHTAVEEQAREMADEQ